jgi:hypothetical protein
VGGLREGVGEGGRNDSNIICTYELKKKRQHSWKEPGRVVTLSWEHKAKGGTQSFLWHRLVPGITDPAHSFHKRITLRRLADHVTPCVISSQHVTKYRR